MFIVENVYYSTQSFKFMRYQYYSIDDIMKQCWKMVFLREKILFFICTVILILCLDKWNKTFSRPNQARFVECFCN